MTTEPRFIQIHWLASYPGTLLNRDDAGLAKRLPLGGTVRTRISSQCLKRHWRTAEDEHALAAIGLPTAVRSKEIVDREIGERLTAKGIAPEIVKAVSEEFTKALYGKNAVDKKKRQALILGWPEVRYLADAAEQVASAATDAKTAEAAAKEFFAKGDGKANLGALRDQAAVPFGLEVALFGRMVTSDPAANKDAAIHVAHAFTVHDEEPEQDYFTVVDDLKQLDEEEDAGAAGVFDTELTSGLYYGYVVVDVPQLVMNLEGVDRSKWLEADTDRTLAGRVVEHLLHLIAKVSPGAKKGSTAPYAHAEFVLVEMGRRQPRTLANAFRQAVSLEGGEVAALAAKNITEFLADMDEMYGAHERRLQASRRSTRLPDVEALPLPDLAQRVNAAIAAGRA